MKTYNSYLISKNRDTIYGLAILYIMFYHSSVQFRRPVLLPLALFKIAGQMGVDIFLFVSGISLYFSAVKGGGVFAFYRRRLKRVLLPSLIVGIPYFFITDILWKHAGASAFFADLSGLSLFLNGNRTIWFVTAILIFYLLYPLIFRALKTFKWSASALIALTAAALLLFLCVRLLSPALWKNGSILFERLIIFMIGAYAGKFVYERREIRVRPRNLVWTAIIFLAFFGVYLVVRFVLRRGQIISERYIYGFIAIFVTVGFSLLGEARPIRAFARRLSPITLEIYLVHEKLIECLSRLTRRSNDVPVNLCAAILAVALAMLLKFAEDRLTRLPRRLKHS